MRFPEPRNFPDRKACLSEFGFACQVPYEEEPRINEEILVTRKAFRLWPPGCACGEHFEGLWSPLR